MTAPTPAATGYQPNRVRGPVNALFFTAADRYVAWLLGPYKRKVLAGLPDQVLELGPGVGANFRYLRPGTKVTAIEPNPAMHSRLIASACRAGIDLDLRGIAGESLDVADAAVGAVISSLVLCTVTDPGAVRAEVRRVLRPGGRFAFVEHVAAPEGSLIRRTQRAVRRPWAWFFEGCSCERDIASLIRSAGFGHVAITPHRIASPLLPFNTQISGIATKST